ncbi:hypothetical protein TanjilG_02915 [Lupinus angustifolius]|uniref:Uncharacterized protein n=1 Tax=Lupinus angustifolius TaxID=3871 RepID=A0A1J7GZN8_LUPAN|nr:hypothetical protein TanjilG_02915 [Lupinus angustifolius]
MTTGEEEEVVVRGFIHLTSLLAPRRLHLHGQTVSKKGCIPLAGETLKKIHYSRKTTSLQGARRPTCMMTGEEEEEVVQGFILLTSPRELRRLRLRCQVVFGQKTCATITAEATNGTATITKPHPGAVHPPCTPVVPSSRTYGLRRG